MSKTVFAFGRMNPPTIGHEKLADKVASEAKRRGAMPHIYLSHTQNAKKDPLPYNVKIAIAKKAFGKTVTRSSSKTIIQVMQELEKMGHTEVVLVAGSDRVSDFETLLTKYNGKEYNFDKIEVVSAGVRDPDAEGVAGMSASKLRAIAKEGDYDTFAKGMSSKLRDSDKKKVYDTIRSVTESINEDYVPTDEELDDILNEIEEDDIFWEWHEDDEDDVELEEAPLTPQQRRKRSMIMKRLAPKIARKRKLAMKKKAGKGQIMKRAKKAAILLLKKKAAGGKNYKDLSRGEKINVDKKVQKKLPLADKIAKRLLPKMVKKETERMKKKSKANEEFEIIIEQKVAQDPDVDERPGSQPKKYFSGVRKKSKEARAKHFERGTKMDDDNPAAYKKAPGDAGAKTKPSKHTKRFKQMFGEQKMECPPATKDVALNTKNRNATRENHMYGPLNVKEPGDYWEKIADKWDTSVEAAKKSVCGNCVAFDISPRMEECLPGPVSDGDGKLGYCWMHHFKCHSARACDTWATGGPIEEDGKSYAWQEKAFGKKEEVEYLEEKQIDALKKKSEKTGIPYGILKQVYNRGMAAWRTGHRPGTTPQQWAFARVNSFATKSKGTWGGADKDLAAKARGSSKKESVTEEDPCWDGYKQVGMKKGASGKMVPNCVPEEVELDEKKQEFETDKDLPNLRRPKGQTDHEFKKMLRIKTKKSFANIREREMTDAEKQKLDKLKKEYEGGDMQKSMKDRYGDDGPFYATLTKMAMKKEAVSPAQQAAIAIAKKKSGKYDDDGKKIDENDAVNALKKDHNKEKERLKDKHDREMDTARLQDTRSKNANEAFEALIEQPCCDDCSEDEYGWAEETDFIAIDEAAAEYQGRKVKLNNPTRSDNPKKRPWVKVKKEKGIS